MKIAIAGGHSKKATGAIGYLNEYDCDRAFVAQLIPALKAAGHTVVNCSNEASTSSAELAEEVRIANASGADLFLAVHFNSGGGTGTEAFTTVGSSAAQIATKMSANVAKAMGIRNRGYKTANFYVLRNTSMPAVLLEVCFVDSITDRDAWNRTSWKALCDAVVDAIGREASSEITKNWEKDSKGWRWKKSDGTYAKDVWVKDKGKWYWLDTNGYAPALCCLKIEGKWYAFDKSCAMKTKVDVSTSGNLVL